MEKIFVEVLRLSVLSGVMVPAVLVIRLFMEKFPFPGKAPKSLQCFLWMLVGIRLVIPFSVESVFGIFPEQSVLERQILGSVAENSKDPLLTSQLSAAGESQKKPLTISGENNSKERTAVLGQDGFPDPLRIASRIWCIGMLLMVLYFAYSWRRLRVCVRESRQREFLLENEKGSKTVRIFLCRGIETPFLFGLLHPEIYVPFYMDEKDLPYILYHELAHKKRRDHLVKPVAFLLLAIHWFNPLLWIAYRMLCKDMELACDERVIRDMAVRDRKEYSRALLNCSVWKEKASAVPVAFGELSVKERIKNILNYKKPTVRAACLGVALCVALLLCFMTRRGAGEGKTVLLVNAAGEAEEAEDFEEESQKSAELVGEAETVDETEIVDETETVDEAETMDEAEGQEDSRPEEFVKAWANAFCDRDGKTIVSLCSEKLLDTLREEETIMDADGESFGWSSPWPWDQETDYEIVEVTDSTARVLYYAWTSDPHVTVWEENLAWHTEGERCVMDRSELTFRDNICSGEEFYSAYPEGSISGTRMDYLNNGAGEALNENAKGNPDLYEPLFAPDTAARFLLNLLHNDEKVEITAEEEESGRAQVTIRFILDHTEASVTMVQPYGEDGIWIPQN